MTTMSQALGAEAAAQWVERLRVSRRIYTDPAIFEKEMERIFGRLWVNVGLEAQIPKPSGYRTTWLGSHPIVLTRDENGRIHGFINACTHKGALVARQSEEVCRGLMCLYHQWQFALDGTLRGVPKYGSMPKDDFRREDFPLERIPRLEVYHGIIYASMNPDAPPLADWLGAVRAHCDDIFSFGDYEIIGHQRLWLRANWKVYLENAKDGYHAGLLHRLLPALGYFYDTRAIAFDHGHGLLRWPTSADLRAATHERGQRVEINDYSILETSRAGWNRVLTIFPNTLISHQADILLFRQIMPRSVETTEILQTGLVPKGASEEFKRRSALQISNYQGSSGWVGYDDIVAMNASQKGMTIPGQRWNYLGMGADTSDPVPPGESEVLIRNFFQYWAAVLHEASERPEGGR